MHVQQRTDGHKGSFYIEQEGEIRAESTYSRAGAELLIIDHTEVDEQLRGTGAGRQLILEIVAWARRDGLRVIPLCPYAKSVFDRDPSLRDVLRT